MHKVLYTKARDQKVSCEACSLANICVTNRLSHDELNDFEKIIKASPLMPKDSLLYRAGDKQKAIYAIKSGSFKGTLTDDEGNVHITGFYTPGDVVGFDGLADDYHQYDVSALDDASVCELPIHQLDEMCEHFPALRKEMNSIVSRKHNNLQSLLMLIGKRPVEVRLAVFLLSFVERYKKRGLISDQIHLSMSRHEIANYLGMTPETLSRQFKRFKKEGIIDIDNHYCSILDEQALNKMAHNCADENASSQKTG